MELEQWCMMVLFRGEIGEGLELIREEEVGGVAWGSCFSSVSCTRLPKLRKRLTKSSQQSKDDPVLQQLISLVGKKTRCIRIQENQ